ncbi:MAG: hypothetical protein J6S85_05810 [Methanobrevibacter sp.]|nr:hypothetical protein [Methanobrevibacter sp.]
MSKELCELKDFLKESIVIECQKSYQQGFYDSLHSAIKGIEVIQKHQKQIPIYIDDILNIMTDWLDSAKKELEEVNKKKGILK